MLRRKRTGRGILAVTLSLIMVLGLVLTALPALAVNQGNVDIYTRHYYPGESGPVNYDTEVEGSVANLLQEYDQTEDEGYVKSTHGGKTYELSAVEIEYQKYQVSLNYYEGSVAPENLIGTDTGYAERGDSLSVYMLTLAEINQKFSKNFDSTYGTFMDGGDVEVNGDGVSLDIIVGKKVTYYIDWYIRKDTTTEQDINDNYNDHFETPAQPDATWYDLYRAAVRETRVVLEGTSINISDFVGYYDSVTDAYWDAQLALPKNMNNYPYPATVPNEGDVFSSFGSESGNTPTAPVGDKNQFSAALQVERYPNLEIQGQRDALENYSADQRGYGELTVRYYYRETGVSDTVTVQHFYEDDQNMNLQTFESFTAGGGHNLMSWAKDGYGGKQYRVEKIVVSQPVELPVELIFVYGGSWDPIESCPELARMTVPGNVGDVIKAEGYRHNPAVGGLDLIESKSLNPASAPNTHTVSATKSENVFYLKYYNPPARRLGPSTGDTWKDGLGFTWTDTVVYNRQDTSENKNYDSYVIPDNRFLVKIYYVEGTDPDAPQVTVNHHYGDTVVNETKTGITSGTNYDLLSWAKTDYSGVSYTVSGINSTATPGGAENLYPNQPGDPHKTYQFLEDTSYVVDIYYTAKPTDPQPGEIILYVNKLLRDQSTGELTGDGKLFKVQVVDMQGNVVAEAEMPANGEPAVIRGLKSGVKYAISEYEYDNSDFVSFTVGGKEYTQKHFIVFRSTLENEENAGIIHITVNNEKTGDGPDNPKPPVWPDDLDDEDVIEIPPDEIPLSGGPVTGNAFPWGSVAAVGGAAVLLAASGIAVSFRKKRKNKQI